MNPLLNETLVSLNDIARRCPRGRASTSSHAAHRTTVLRWIIRGVTVKTGAAKVKLEAVRIGKRWVTSEEAYSRFVTACGAAAGVVTTPPVTRSPAATRRASERADREIDRLLARAKGK